MHKLRTTENAQIGELFRLVDTNDSGMLDYAEIQEGLQLLKNPVFPSLVSFLTARFQLCVRNNLPSDFWRVISCIGCILTAGTPLA